MPKPIAADLKTEAEEKAERVHATKSYHFGILLAESERPDEPPQPQIPYWNVTVGGVCFSAFSEKVVWDKKNNKTTRSQIEGDYAPFTDEDVTRIKTSINARVVRWSSKKGNKGFIIAKDNNYRKQVTDDPLRTFLYMEEVPEEIRRPKKPMGE